MLCEVVVLIEGVPEAVSVRVWEVGREHRFWRPQPHLSRPVAPGSAIVCRSATVRGLRSAYALCSVSASPTPFPSASARKAGRYPKGYCPGVEKHTSQVPPFKALTKLCEREPLCVCEGVPVKVEVPLDVRVPLWD